MLYSFHFKTKAHDEAFLIMEKVHSISKLKILKDSKL